MKSFRHLAVLLAALFSTMAGAWAQSAQQTSKEPVGSISGRVTLGGKPLPGVTVSLISPDGEASRVPVIKDTTDQDGRFRLTGIATGRYTVAPFAPTMSFKDEPNMGIRGKNITITDGEDIDDLDFALTRGGVVTGRVTDAEGRPVIGESVQLHPLDSAGWHSQFILNPSMFETDDRGVYRIYGLEPGRYIVSAEKDAQAPTSSGMVMGPYVRTFHPNVTDQAKARIIEVTEGGEVTGVDISLARASKPYTVTGRAVDAETGKPIANLLYGYSLLEEDGKSIEQYTYFDNRTNARGEFRIEIASPGRYAVGLISDGKSELYSEPAVFEISNGDVKGLEIKAHRGASVSGVIVVEGTNDPDIAAKVYERGISFYPADDNGDSVLFRARSNQIGSDGRFYFAGLRPGKFRIGLTWSDRRFSILRVERSGVDQNMQLEVGRGEQITDVQVVAAYYTAVVRGRVKVEGGKLPADALLLIGIRRAGDGSDFSDAVEVDASRRFIINGLATGEYELNLILLIPNGPDGSQPHFPSAIQKISVEDGAEMDVTLTINLSERQKEKGQ